MATAPTSPITWTALPATNPSVGPDLAYSIQSSGTLIGAPNAPGSFTCTGTELSPGATITWVEIESDDTDVMGTILFASISASVAAYFIAGRLLLVEGAS